MKKRAAILMATALCLLLFTSTALAYEVGDKRVTLGADLTAEQRAQIFNDFGLKEGAVKELKVTNADERAYLAGLVPDGKIGSVALSSIYIEILGEGDGLNISTNNINWATSDMYRNALSTAGIVDAKVIVSAPFPVSGTAAMTGVYKAYEDITGLALTDIAKAVGIEELITTAQLADYIGSDEATKLIAELKTILDQTKNMPDDEVRKEIKNLAEQYNISLTDGQIDQVLKLCRSMENLDVNELKARIEGLANTLQTVKKAESALSTFTEGVKNFFVSIGNFFARLFGGGK